MYAATESGWMTTQVFQSWFEAFLLRVTERPLLIIFDGHKTHLSLPFILLARENGVSVIKLPSHTSNRLQPLDVSCFKPLKTAWDKELVRKQRETGFRHLSKSDFVDSLCSVWEGALTPDNVKAGFMKTGTFPLDKSQFPVTAFQKTKLLAYQALNPMPPPQQPALPADDLPLAVITAPLLSPIPAPFNSLQMASAGTSSASSSAGPSALITELLATVARLSNELRTHPVVTSPTAPTSSQAKSLADVSVQYTFPFLKTDFNPLLPAT